jgi:glycosyltransferase involved in cell wall biosynthesis
VNVSVAMGTYNGEAFVGEQLASLASQTCTPDELVVCDDCSEDATVELVERFAAGAPFPVRVHRNERRLGFADNFLRAAGLCRSELVAFCDQDDVWKPEKLAVCERPFVNPDVAAVVHAGEIVDADLRPNGATFPPMRAPVGDPWLHVPGYALVFRRSLLELLQGDRPTSRAAPVPMAHDEFVYFLALACARVIFLSEVLVLHRMHGANQCPIPALDHLALVRASLEAGSQRYRDQADLARKYAQFLTELAATQPTPVRERLERAGRQYERLTGLLTERAALHDPGVALHIRARRLARLARMRAYVPRAEGGLGRRALAKDAAVTALGRYKRAEAGG